MDPDGVILINGEWAVQQRRCAGADKLYVHPETPAGEGVATVDVHTLPGRLLGGFSEL